MNAKENIRIFGRGLAWSTMVAVPLTLVMLDGLKKCEEIAITTEAAQCDVKDSRRTTMEERLPSQSACRDDGRETDTGRGIGMTR